MWNSTQAGMLSLCAGTNAAKNMQSTSTTCGIQCNTQPHLVVEGTDVQGRVPRRILGTHVCSIEQQVFQVLHMPKAAGLGKGVESGQKQGPTQTELDPAPSSLPTWWISCQPFSSVVPSCAWS